MLRKIPNPSGTSRAFTLIELLVVVAIISLLVSILLPSLQQAKTLAKQVICSSNLKQLSLVVPIYANDFDGHFPTFLFDRDGDGKREQPWGVYLAQEDYCSMDMIRCPSAVEGDPFLQYGYSYGMNPTNSGVNPASLPSPSSTCFIGDGWNIAYYELYGGYSYYKYGYALVAESSTSYGCRPDFRHPGGCNILYVDGHVETLSQEEIPTDNTDLFWDGN